MAKNGIHINKHQKVRRKLEKNQEVFAEETEKVWRSFQKIENQIRPGQTYGGKIDGKELEKARNLYSKIKNVCLEVLGEDDDIEEI